MQINVPDLELFEQWPRIQSRHSSYRLTPVTDEEPLTPRDLGGHGGLIPGYSEKRIRQFGDWTVKHHDPGRDPFLILRQVSKSAGHPYLSINGPGPKEFWDLLEIVSHPHGALRRPYKDAEWRFRRLRQVLVEVC